VYIFRNLYKTAAVLEMEAVLYIETLVSSYQIYGVKSPKRVILKLPDSLQCSRTATPLQHRAQTVAVLLCLHVQFSQ